MIQLLATMKMNRPVFLFLLLSSNALAGPDNCPIVGEMVQWIADYCMAAGQTDDLEVVMPCIERESQIQFRSSCIAKHYFKRRMCEITYANSALHKSVDECLNDPGFVGPTVGSGSSGG